MRTPQHYKTPSKIHTFDKPPAVATHTIMFKANRIQSKPNKINPVHQLPVVVLWERPPVAPPPALCRPELGFRGWGRGWDRAHTCSCPGDVLRQVESAAPASSFWAEDLGGVREGQSVPAVPPQHIDVTLPHSHGSFAAGPQKGGHARPLFGARLKRLHVQDVEAFDAVLVVVAAAQDVDALANRCHAVPATCQEHGWTLSP